MSALPVVGNETSLARNYLEAPMVGVAEAFHPRWYSDPLKYVIAAAATATLIAAAGSAMLGLSRLSYALSTNRQIPSALGRLHPRRGTPYVVDHARGAHRGRSRLLRTTSSSSSACTPSAGCSA